MKAAFDIKFDGIATKEKIRNLIQSIEVTDEVGIKSDTISIILDDSKGDISLPKSLVTVSARMGYGVDLVDVGSYHLDEVEVSDSSLLILGGKSVALGSDIKTIRSRSFSSRVFGEIIGEVAKANGLTAVVDEAVKNIKLDKSPVQRRERDMAFLTRMCEGVGCGWKVASNRLVVSKMATGNAVSGRKLPRFKLSKKDLSSWKFQYNIRDQYRSAEAKVYDAESGKPLVVREGRGDPVFSFQDDFSDEVTAREACKARLRESAFTESEFFCTLKGNPLVKAQSPVSLIGFKKEIDGLWFVKSAKHLMDAKSFMTELRLIQSKI